MKMNELSKQTLFARDIEGISRSPGGKFVALFDSEKYIKFIHSDSKEVYSSEFNWHNNKVYDIAWKGEEQFVSVSQDAKAILWDIEKKERIKQEEHLDRTCLRTCCYDAKQDKFFVSGTDGGIIELLK